MFEYLAICVVALVIVWVVWDLARRRAAADRKRRELEPYAKLGEGIEGVAHDARHMLRAARSVLDRLSTESSLDEHGMRFVERADEQVQEADSFLRALATRPDQPQLFDAVGCLRMIVAVNARRYRIDKRGLSGELKINGEPRKLARILANLIANALEHSDEARVERDGRSLIVDNPLHGEPPGQEIYERGVSTKRGSKGLGLYWSRQMAVDFGGSLDHEILDKGSRGDPGPWVRFRLSFEDDDAADGPADA